MAAVKRPFIAAAALAGLLAAAACAPDFEFEPWLLPVPAGTRLVGHAEATERDRAAAVPIALLEEFVIGARGDDFNYLFGRSAPRLAIAADGRVFVLDGSNYRIQVFGADGEFLATIGRRGQGPGEIGQAIDFVIEGEEVRLWDVRNRRTTRWSLEGDLLGSEPMSLWGGPIVQLAGGDLVWRASERTPTGRDLMFRRVTADAETMTEYARMQWPERVVDPPFGAVSGTESDAWWAGIVPPSFHAGADGTVYVSPFEEYQVFAYAPDGEMRWAMQVAHNRPPLSQIEIDFHMTAHTRRFPERKAAQVPWPELQYALAEIKVDGHGHVYVFPYEPKGTPLDQPRPVDVYSRDGERLYSGTISSRMFSAAFAMYNGPMLEVAWQIANGDTVWGVAEAEETGNYEVVRYRLVEPF